MTEHYQFPEAQSAPSNATGLTLSIIGLVFGTLSLLFSFIPCIGAIALWPGLVSLVLSAIGAFTLRGSKALGIVAVAVSLGSVVIAIYQREQVKEAVRDGGEQLKQDLKRFEQDFRKDADRIRQDIKDKAPKLP